MPLFKKLDHINGLNYTWWYWSSSPVNDPNTVTHPAALYTSTGLLITGLPTSGGPTTPTPTDVVFPRSIAFTLTGSPGVTIKVVEDHGNLDFTLTATGKANLTGLFFDFTNTKLSTLKVSGPDITQFLTNAGRVSTLANGANLSGQKVSTFDVGMEFGLAGIGGRTIQSESFVLSDKAQDLSIDDLHPQSETGAVGVTTLSVAQKLEAVAPYAPTAAPDTVSVLEDGPSITIKASALATDKNSGAVLTIDKIGTGAQGPQYGTVKVAADGKSLQYTPTTLDYLVGGILTGDQDAFQVSVKDNLGGEVTSFVTVNETPVAEKPTVTVQVLAPEAGDPINEVRLLVTAQSGDYGTVNAGSDFIQSLGLKLTGDVTTGTTITDGDGLLSGDRINASSNTGLFEDEVDLLLPTNTSVNDTLAVTGTGAETESPTTTATSAAFDQTLAIENVQTLTDLNFTTSGQSIWETGTGTVEKDYSTGFLGLDKSVSTGGGVTIPGFTIGTPTIGTTKVPPIVLGSGKASAHVRLGVEADLKISSGDVNATLPYEVDLDSTYNKTTDTLQITASDMLLGGGKFTAHGPTGTIKFGLDVGIKGSAKLTLFSGVSLGTSITFGSFTKPVYTLGLKSSAKFGSLGFISSRVPIPKDIGTLTLAFPKVNTRGSNPNPGTISGTGTSNNIVNITGDLVQLVNSIAPILPGISEIHTQGKAGSSLDFVSLKALLSVGLALVQKFNLSSSGLEGPGDTVPVLVLGDPGDQIFEPLTFGAPLTIPDASALMNPATGKIDISLALVPEATLTNNTSLQPNMKVALTVASVSFGALGIHVGPLTAYKNTNLAIPLPTLPSIYSNTFQLTGWNTQTVTQAV